MKAIYTLVGMRHRDAEAFVKSLPEGEPLTLERDPNNEHDPSAVKVIARERHVAFVKATQAAKLAAEMDRRRLATLVGRLVNVDRWPCAEVEE